MFFFFATSFSFGWFVFTIRGLFWAFVAWVWYWMQYFTIVYIIGLLLYNFYKAKPHKWPRLFLRKLLAFFIFSAKRFVRFFWRAFYFFLRLFGILFFLFCSFISYLEESCFEIVEFFSYFDFLSEFSWSNLRIALRETALAFFSLYKAALIKHVVFICSSGVAFIERPMVYRWTFFRFFKHVIGWSFGFSFFFYLFLWLSYFVYVIFDCFFIFIHIICFYFLQSLFFHREVHWEKFYVVYSNVMEPARIVIMLIIFDRIPFIVKLFKDMLTSHDLWVNKIFWSIVVRSFLRLVVRIINSVYFFIAFRCYYQTRYFFRIFLKKWYFHLRFACRVFYVYITRWLSLFAALGFFYGSWRFLFVLADFFSWLWFCFKIYFFRRAFFVLKYRFSKKTRRFVFFFKMLLYFFLYCFFIFFFFFGIFFVIFLWFTVWAITLVNIILWGVFLLL